jgi:putative ABC transport system permease protein
MTGSRAMFWRILRRQIFANRGRLFVVLLALAAGAAITAALLNLQVDAKRRLTTEFRAFGSNVILTPRTNPGEQPGPQTFEETVFDRVPSANFGAVSSKGAFLYSIADATVTNKQNVLGATRAVLVVGYRWSGEGLNSLIPSTEVEGQNTVVLDVETCELGQQVATALQAHVGDQLQLKVGDKEVGCVISQVRSFGGPEDGQIFAGLPIVQELTGKPAQVTLIQMNVPGTPRSIETYCAELQKQLPELNVRPIRQFSEVQGKIYEKISGLLTATVVLVLILTALCVLAAMTNVAMERRNDVGLMKAIGGASRRVLRLFLTEAALLGLVGGLIGAAVGILLSIGLGKAVFGIAARPRLIVYPISVGLTIIVAIASSYPLRRLASIRPASVFRGEA